MDRRNGLLADAARQGQAEEDDRADNFDSVSKEAFYGGKGSNAGGYAKMSGRGAYGRDLEQEDTKHLENRDILSLQQDMMKRQIRSLDELHDTVSDLENIGEAIGEGIDLTTALLDDIHGSVDTTTGALAKRTDRADELRKTSGNCTYYLLILGLTVLLVLNIYVRLHEMVYGKCGVNTK